MCETEQIVDQNIRSYIMSREIMTSQLHNVIMTSQHSLLKSSEASPKKIASIFISSTSLFIKHSYHEKSTHLPDETVSVRKK